MALKKSCPWNRRSTHLKKRKGYSPVNSAVKTPHTSSSERSRGVGRVIVNALANVSIKEAFDWFKSFFKD